jgi:histidinol-phosphate phosphatase family protein
MNLSTVAILAGGFGTRLKSRTGNVPKPMALILGKPVLEYQILLCKKYGFTDISLLVHYGSEAIKDYFNDGSNWGVNISYVEEKDPRGTAGALLDALSHLNDIFLVLYGDTYLDVDLGKFYKFHIDNKSEASIMLHPNDHPSDSDLVEIDSEFIVTKLYPYPHPEDIYINNLVNAGLYVLNKSALYGIIPQSGKYDLAKHTFSELIKAGRRILGYKSQEYIKDMGTPDRLDKVESDIINGVTNNLSNRQPRKAVFIDRDGTINKEVNHLKRIEDFHLMPKVGAAIRKLNRAGFLSICVTNQPVIARGDLTYDGLKEIHNKMDYELGLHGAYLDHIYVCPHHNERGFDGEVIVLKIDCECRKPKTGLIDKAVREMYVDRRNSWFIGDTTTDIKAGFDAGLRTILVRTGYAGNDLKCKILPDFIFPDLDSAVDFVLHGYNTLIKKIIPILPSLISERLILIGGPARSGKSTVAQALSNIISETGLKSHIISLDGWLKPLENRKEGIGVLNRYSIDLFLEILKGVLKTEERFNIDIPIYDRFKKTTFINHQISVGPKDLLIVEGVPALLSEEINKLTDSRIFVDIDEKMREERLIADYSWRTDDINSVKKQLSSRLTDEVIEVRNSEKHATFKIIQYDYK